MRPPAEPELRRRGQRRRVRQHLGHHRRQGRHQAPLQRGVPVPRRRAQGRPPQDQETRREERRHELLRERAAGRVDQRFSGSVLVCGDQEGLGYANPLGSEEDGSREQRRKFFFF